MKIFTTNYALTAGILKFDVDGDPVGLEGKDWHRTKEEAIARAEQMRVAKIKTLQKSIDKLEKLTFK